MVLALLTPFAAFWVPEALGGSGVLATVTAGLFVSWNGPRFISPATRLQGFFVWGLVNYLIEGVIFLLMGLQAPVIMDHLDLHEWDRLALAARLVSAAIIAGALCLGVCRHLSAAPAVAALRRRNPAPPWRYVFVVGFTGIRGVVSLAAALVHSADGGRRAVSRTRHAAAGHLRGDPGDAGGAGIHLCMGDPGAGAGGCGLARVGGGQAPRSRRPGRRHRCGAGAGWKAWKARAPRPQPSKRSSGGTATGAPISWRPARIWNSGDVTAAYSALQLRFLEAERASIAELYAKGELDDEARRRIERELDLDDSRIRHAAASGTSRLV